MFAKFVAVLAFAAVAAASTADFNNFSYAVSDPYTGDFKHQFESRAEDNVNGQYSLIEPDGSRRTVDYAAGAEGFNAIVRKDPAIIATKAIATPVIAAKAIATPIAAAPVFAKTLAAPFVAAKAFAPISYSAYPYAAYPYAQFFPKFGYPYAYARYY